MNFEFPEKVARLREKVVQFMEQRVFPAEHEYYEQLEKPEHRWTWVPVMRELRAAAKAEGLWNFPLEERLHGGGLSLSEYAPIAETIAQTPFGTEVFNCYSGTILNAKLLDQFGGKEVKNDYLTPLVNGEIRACISITEPDVPSSDPTDLKLSARREGNEYVINGQKSWATGMMMKECRVILLLACTDPEADRHRRHSIIVVPREAQGVKVGKNQSAYGYDHAPFGHPDLAFDQVRVPVTNLLGEEGTGFQLMQTGLGFGRVQIGMGSVGAAERALREMCRRVDERIIGGRPLAERGVVAEAIARSRIEIEQARLLVLKTAWLLDTYGAKAARSEIAQTKAWAPRMAQQVLDRAIQFHGGEGISHTKPLAEMWAYQRCCRIGEGADEVHMESVARLEMARQREARSTPTG
jgi:acyl-CoA dehydrogenase